MKDDHGSGNTLIDENNWNKPGKKNAGKDY